LQYHINSTEITNLYRLSGFASPEEPSVRSAAWKGTMLIHGSLVPEISSKDLDQREIRLYELQKQKHKEEVAPKEKYASFFVEPDYHLSVYDLDKERQFQANQSSSD